MVKRVQAKRAALSFASLGTAVACPSCSQVHVARAMLVLAVVSLPGRGFVSQNRLNVPGDFAPPPNFRGIVSVVPLRCLGSLWTNLLQLRETQDWKGRNIIGDSEPTICLDQVLCNVGCFLTSM